jgi:hypothetical protein
LLSENTRYGGSAQLARDAAPQRAQRLEQFLLGRAELDRPRELARHARCLAPPLAARASVCFGMRSTAVACLRSTSIACGPSAASGTRRRCAPAAPASISWSM